MGRLLLGVTLAVAVGAGCSVFGEPDPWCPPVDPGGDCFMPSEAAFVAHALESASAWPQLRGLPLTAGPVIEGFDAAAGQRTWVVPVFSGGRTVAASRFLPFEGYVKLAEVALYAPPRDGFPIPRDDDRLVLSEGPCGDPMPEACLFLNYQWTLE